MHACMHTYIHTYIHLYTFAFAIFLTYVSTLLPASIAIQSASEVPSMYHYLYYQYQY